MSRSPLRIAPPFHTPESNFINCIYAGGACPCLEHGRFYSCMMPAYAHHLIEYFKLDDSIHVSKRDSVNIYELNRPEELLEFLRQPMPFCRFCDLKHITHNLPWERSQCDINEWIDKVVL